MRTTEDRLPHELSFQADGHVTDLVLDSLADGETAIVPADAHAHLSGCGACTERLGAAALLSWRASERLVAAHRHVLPAPVAVPIAQDKPSRALPVRALVAAFGLAALGALPMVLDGASRISGLVRVLPRLLPIAQRTAVTLVHALADSYAGLSTWVLWTSAGLLLVAGMAVARAMSGRPSVEGGVG